MKQTLSRHTPRSLELLAPAADKDVAIAAITHGADAVYMGASSHGARKKAANSIEDIAEVVEFAHRFRAKVYVTVNTLVYENEIPQVERLVGDLDRIGVDAIIVQDMSLLRMDIPDIELHASTQCDTRTPEKARFLQDAGFSQIVLARELSISEIGEICRTVSVPVETFVHGALCVSYSGRCGASCLSLGRSANRGECAQMCRMPYTLRNGRGEVLEKDKYLLSLRDFNASDSLEQLVEAGVSSFKIEGRLKDADYVKNVTAWYRRRLDEIIAAAPERYRRASAGSVRVDFEPDPRKSFNRGFTDYFLHGRSPKKMASLLTPKTMGEEIEDISQLNNGDGISFFNESGEYEGVLVNGVSGSRIIGSRPFRLPKGAVIHRTYDKEWQRQMSRPTAERTISLDISLSDSGISAEDERGVKVFIPWVCTPEPARNPIDFSRYLGKLGNTIYRLRGLRNEMSADYFIPASRLTDLRREMTAMLDEEAERMYVRTRRRPESREARYPAVSLDARDNVANSLAETFYRDHGVDKMEKALEIERPSGDVEVMTTRYCIRRELGACLKDRSVPADRRARFSPPLTISTGNHCFRLDFDCVGCEMHVVRK